MSRATLDAIVLAGDRGPGDPLAAAAGKPGKALVEVGGRSMLARVLDAVSGVENIEGIVPVCPDGQAYRSALGSAFAARRVEPRDGPAASVAAALERCDPERPVLVVTADHPLLRADWLMAFAERALATGAEAVVGVVEHARVVERFPGHRRTRYRFADGAVCGTNLFWFSGGRATRVAEAWRSFEADRKKPWKIVSRIGLGVLTRYVLGRLTLDDAADRLSRRLGVRVAAVDVGEPDAAVDVDTAADLELVGALIARREAGAA